MRVKRSVSALAKLLKGDSEVRWIVAERLARRIHPQAVLGEREKYWTQDCEFLDHTGRLPINARQLERLWLLDQASRSLAELDGCFVECGTYKGASASFLCKNASPSRTVHVFDSWSGLSEPGSADGSYWQAGDMKSGRDEAERVLSPYSNACYHQGWIPEVLQTFEESSVAFIHLDLDLYAPTLEALVFFWPHLVSGGMVICDDSGFTTCPGARLAMRSFDFGDAKILDLPTGQTMVVKA